MSKHKNKQHGAAVKGQPPVGPRQHLLDEQKNASVEIHDEGKMPVQNKGQARSEQTKGHHGGSQRQTQNRGRG